MAPTASSPVTAGPVEHRPDGSVHLHVKVVPGASTAALAGAYGDRLKLRVTAAAEGGKANKAVVALLADALGLSAHDVTMVRGATNAQKTFAVRGRDAAEVAARLGLEHA